MADKYPMQSTFVLQAYEATEKLVEKLELLHEASGDLEKALKSSRRLVDGLGRGFAALDIVVVDSMEELSAVFAVLRKYLGFRGKIKVYTCHLSSEDQIKVAKLAKAAGYSVKLGNEDFVDP